MEEVKQCSGCGEVKGVSDFYLRSPGKLRRECKACRGRKDRAWRKSNPETANRHVRANQQYVNEIKARSRCIDCGYSGHHAALQFDHVDPRSKWSFGRTDYNGCRGRALHMSWSREHIDNEIAKCEVVCANCHSIRTYKARNKETP